MDVNRWFDIYSATAPGGANSALTVMHQILNHAKVHGHIETNPANGIRRNLSANSTAFFLRMKSFACTQNWTSVLPSDRHGQCRRTSFASCF